MSDFADQAKRRAAEAAEQIKERLGDPEKARELASELAEEAAVFVKKHPLSSVAGAAAFGFVLGLMVGRK